jgi:glutamate formiminotransferase/formiminotetrahydrofolate cyclodeaminase
MANNATDGLDRAEAMRRALIEAALSAHEDAGLSGLCAEGRWEAAIDAMRSIDLANGSAAAVPVPRGRSTAEPAARLATSLSGVVTAVAGTVAPPPGGGSVAAAAGALAAALTQMVAGLAAGRPRYAHVAVEMQDAAQRAAVLAADLSSLVRRDAIAFEVVAAAYKLPKGASEAASARAAAIERAMHPATEAPFEIARAAAAVAELAASVAERGNTNATADAAVATLLADAVCRAAALTVRVNATALRDTQSGLRLTREALGFAEAAASAAARAVAAVNATPLV